MITGKIDVKKIDKDELYQGEKGTYLDIVLYVNKDEFGNEVPDQYGNDGVIKQGLSKASRDAKKKQPILGNYKKKESTGFVPKLQTAFKNAPKKPEILFDDLEEDPIPF
jgi:hypothetical protein